MAYWLDYSAAKLSGQTIRDAGYTGAIRYIDRPDLLRTKHTNKAEYESLRAAGLSVMLVMQTTTTASDGGWVAGVDHARRALAGAEYLGYTGPIFFTNDRTTLPNPAVWRSYLDGAASVLGRDRIGAYGFRNAMDAAVGHAAYFWQAGRRSDVAPHTHIWQDNNTQVTVGGITCDRNLILRELPAEDPLSWDTKLDDPSKSGIQYFAASEWLTWANINAANAQKAAEAVQREVSTLEAKVSTLEAKVDALNAKLDAFEAGRVDVAELAARLAPALADVSDRRARDGDPTTGPVT